MLKAIGKTKDGKRAILLGLSRRNCEKLLEGKPIEVDVGTMCPGFNLIICLMADETEAAMLKELRRRGQWPKAVHPVTGEEGERLENPNG